MIEFLKENCRTEYGVRKVDEILREKTMQAYMEAALTQTELFQIKMLIITLESEHDYKIEFQELTEEEQQDNNIIKRAEWRKDRFLEKFNKRYNEMSLFKDILKFKKVAGSQQEPLHMYRKLSKRVVDQTIDMLEAIKDMTEYDYNFCFKEKEEEEKYDKRNM